ncbi:MAG: glycosyltransferase family 4 protein [Magnetococcales bacterium]|nr:glycosyltransferase family 4 protein [Magnetococcales bacterium]
MNVALLLLRYRPHGGYERQARLLAEALLRQGHDVTIYCNRWPDTVPQGLRFRKVPVVPGASWLQSLTYAWQSRRILAREGGGFDHVIGFDRGLGVTLYRAGNACHREWLAVRRRLEGWSGRLSIAINPLHPILNAIEGRLFAALERERRPIVVLSRRGAEQIRAHYPVSPERFVVIPPAIDLERFAGCQGAEYRQRQRAALGLADDERMVLHVGSGFRIKGVETVLRALAVLIRERSMGGPVRLVVAGRDRRLTRRLTRLARTLDVAERVVFTGATAEVGALYAAADLFVMLSRLDTFGVAVAEALSFGLPVVVGAGAGAADLVTDAAVGTVVDSAIAPAELAAVLQERLASPGGERERAQRHAAAAVCERQRVMERYLELLSATR